MVRSVFHFMPMIMSLLSAGLNVTQLRQIVAEHGVKCILVFGDSSIDPGNNNWLSTRTKSNFPPYGKNFISGLPTGRFSNGRLATDFIGKI